jgi:hypothetical protein
VKELRDLSASIAQTVVGRTSEENEVFLESSNECFLGHSVDEMHYRKMHELSPEFRLRQYQLVEPFLNIISSPNGAVASKLEETTKEVEKLRNEINEMKPFHTPEAAMRRLRKYGKKLLPQGRNR